MGFNTCATDTNFRVMISPKETSKSRNNPIAPYISDVIVIPATELKVRRDEAARSERRQ